MSRAATPLVVIDIVGLTPSLLGEHTPNLNALVQDGFMATLDGVFPAVTCTAQASMLTGTHPDQHGIVANGWFYRDLSEVWFWRQCNRLVQGDKVWHEARENIEGFTCAQLFWWYNMYADVDWSVTPRPFYPADGRKIPALYSEPDGLHAQLERELGPFPFFNFWGPKADIRASDWIARCAVRVFAERRATLQFVYLPHLDYNLQRLGPDHPDIWQDVAAIDAVAGKLIDQVRAAGADVLVVSEYGIETATGTVDINRILRTNGWLRVRRTLDWEELDCGASAAFAVADHQIAHVYIRNPGDVAKVARQLRGTEGIGQVLQQPGQAALRLDHPRSGELVLIAAPGYWFTYYYWLDDKLAPDYARTVDIHRKPGYDPVELFIDPEIRFPTLKAAARVAQKKLGFRMLMDMIPLDASLVKGTHGRLFDDVSRGPMLIGTNRAIATDRYDMTDVRSLILRHWT